MKDNRDTDGYELLHSQESQWGDGRVSGVKIFVKESSRPLIDRDHEIARDAADKMMLNMDIEAARRDPEGPKLREELRRQFAEAFERAGAGPIFMQEVSNGYGDSSRDAYYVNRPWFRVTTRIGHILIGWRRHVINIDWSETVDPPLADHLFPDATTTKGGYYIHALSLEHAWQYLQELHLRPCSKCGGCGSVSVPGELHDVTCRGCDGRGKERE